MNKETFINQTYQLALKAQSQGDHPFGSLLIIDDKVVLTSENTVVTDNDVTQHAELRLVSLASKQFSVQQLSMATLYTSTEPCAMCAGAIFWSGISKIVYGCSTEKLGEIAGGNFVVPCRDLFKFGKREINIIGPVLEEKGAEIHRNFWPLLKGIEQ